MLEVISRSAFDLQPVFETVAESAVRLCEADKAIIFRFDGELLRLAVGFNASPELVEFIRRNPIRPGEEQRSGRAALERQTIHIHDARADPEFSYGSRDGGLDPDRCSGVPLLRKGDDCSARCTIYRLEVRPFTDQQIALLETFADQAVIAIENARLFEELQERTASWRARSRSCGARRGQPGGHLVARPPGGADTIVANAVQLSGADAGTIYELDERSERVRADARPTA